MPVDMNKTELPKLRNVKAAIFDMDGTLLDTLEDIGNSVNEVLKNRVLPTHRMEAYRYFVGYGIEHLMEISLPEKRRTTQFIKDCLEELRVVYNRNLNTHTKLYEGIPRLLDTLAQQGKRLGILTNKPHQMALQCVNTHLNRWNMELKGLDEKTHPKPNPEGALRLAKILQVDPKNCLFIGDTDVDMVTAKNAGMTPIGVTWGFRNEEELRMSGAKFIVNTALELENLLTNPKDIELD